MSTQQLQGYHSGVQGHFAEQYVRALASAAGFGVGKQDPEPVGVDLSIKYTRRHDIPWPSQTIEVSVKSTKNPIYGPDGSFQYDIKAEAHDVLCGTYPTDFDIRRYLIVVVVPPSRRDFASMESDGLRLSREAYILDLMGRPPIGPSATQSRLSFPPDSLLTPLKLSEYLFDHSGKAQQWASM
ncbi:protein of unknown function [Pseudarthrobacter equi]|uniref:Uncharacterized protein n=1 Tax=Pseudarthrobacter equi TaxID=728066 RepID=A0A1H1VWJ8_9MICC|nr:protein of unknown function [Pseudarthrobacter equi]